MVIQRILYLCKECFLLKRKAPGDRGGCRWHKQVPELPRVLNPTFWKEVSSLTTAEVAFRRCCGPWCRCSRRTWRSGRWRWGRRWCPWRRWISFAYRTWPGCRAAISYSWTSEVFVWLRCPRCVADQESMQALVPVRPPFVATTSMEALRPRDLPRMRFIWNCSVAISPGGESAENPFMAC